jgi:hypothetical protein
MSGMRGCAAPPVVLATQTKFFAPCLSAQQVNGTPGMAAAEADGRSSSMPATAAAEAVNTLLARPIVRRPRSGVRFSL